MITTLIIEERIKQLRTQKLLSQGDLAKKAGISSNYLGQVERGERCPTLDTLLKISSGLEISLSVLFNDSLSVPQTIYTPQLNKVIRLLDSYSPKELDSVYKILSCVDDLRTNKKS